MTISVKNPLKGLAVAAFATLAMAGMSLAQAPLQITLALQATGTGKWELAAMQALGIDKKHNLEVILQDVADSAAGQLALQAKQADVILSDFVWVALQRDHGNMVTYVPHSLTVGGLIVDPAAGIASLADLKGKTLAISGSPVDKSYVILAADYNKLTGGNLNDDAEPRFGAPPLINELITGGQAQASLNLWNWNARAKLAGKTELISVAAMLKDLGVSETPPLLGWAFFDETAKAKPDAIKAYIDASFETKAALLTDDAVWDKIRPAMNVKDDDALFRQLRDDYRTGIVKAFTPGTVTAAREAFEVMAKFGGKETVGDITAIPDGTFYTTLMSQ
jgi:NitT/TauT family transport system substrate-binding protein